MHVDESSSGPSTIVPGAKWSLALLLGINLFNYIDRQVLSAVIPKLKRDTTIFDPDDIWRNSKIGLLSSAFMVVYMLLSPLFARAGDKFRRWFIIGVGVSLWSLASGSSGVAHTYWLIFLTRCFVGVGEAAYGPIAPAMLSDLFPSSIRGKVLSYFYAAIPVGSALGFVLGGILSDHFGWRHAFWLTYLGLIPGLVCFFMKEPPRIVTAERKQTPRYLAVLRELRKNRSFVLCSAGMTCTTFVLGGVAVWVPEYIFQREATFALTTDSLAKLQNEKEFKSLQGVPLVPNSVIEKLKPHADGKVYKYAEFDALLNGTLTPDEQLKYGEYVREAATDPKSTTSGEIAIIFGALLVVCGLIATLSGGWFGDWLGARGVRGAYFHASGWTTLLAWPFFVGMLFCPFPYAWGLLVPALFLLFFNTGPANTILANVSRSAIRATAFGINILVIHALGDAFSPVAIGFVQDISTLHTAFLIVSFLILIGGGLWVLGAKYLDEDTRLAHEADTAKA